MPPTIRPAIAAMKGYAPPKEGRTGLRLDFNENTVGCSPAVLAALREVTGEDLARYPEYNAAEAEIAAAFGHTAASCTITNGVDDAILLAALTFVDPGDEVVIVEPTFSMYRFYCQQLGAELRRVRFDDVERAPGVREFVFSPAAVRAAITDKTRVVFVASPNNPTGSLAEREDLLAIARDYPNVALFVDEAYADFVSEDNRGLLDDVLRVPNLLVARTFSKAYGLAGARLGCLFAHPELMPTLRKAHSPYNVNTLAVICGRAAVRDRDFVAGYRRAAISSRALIEEALTELGVPWWRSAANFVLFEAGDASDFLMEETRLRGILIRDRRGDHPGTLRITCGTVEQTEFALDVLRELWTRFAARQSPGPAAGRATAIAFDMDGVLVDVVASYRAAIGATVEALGGGPVSPEQIQELKNEGGYNNDWTLSQELLRRRGIAVDYERVVEVFTGFYQGENWDGLVLREKWLFPIPLLKALYQRYRLAIFTGRPRQDAEFVLRRFGVAEYFDELVTLEDVAEGKPHPEGLLELAARLAPATPLAYIGDTIDDARCAAAAGLAFIGILPSTHLSAERLRGLFAEAGCRLCVEHVGAAAAALLDGDTFLTTEKLTASPGPGGNEKRG